MGRRIERRVYTRFHMVCLGGLRILRWTGAGGSASRLATLTLQAAENAAERTQ